VTAYLLFKGYGMKIQSRLTNGIFYSVMILIFTSIVVLLAPVLGANNCTWILISAVVCLELDIEKRHSIAYKRIAATMFGALFPVVLMHLSTNILFIVIVSIISITMICHLWAWIEPSWKLAVATGCIVALSCVNSESIVLAKSIAYRRVQDVVIGCLLSIVLNIVVSSLVKSRLVQSVLLVFISRAK
jgi:uncharacterized membrane protein YgaE (UPF0421/DUF939 family)